jgi:transposase
MTGMQSPESADVEVVLGVDTHLDFHLAVALDNLGRRLGELAVPTTTKGYKRLVCWAEDFGAVRCTGVEDGRRAQEERRRSRGDDQGFEDRPSLCGESQGPGSQPATGPRRLTAPDALRDRLRCWLSIRRLLAAACRFRPGTQPETPEAATKLALRSVARRHQSLSEEIAELDIQLDRLVAEAAPELLALPAVGTDHAATLLVVAGDNPERLRSEASFPSLCGASPVEASSGKVVRHRLNLK